MDFCNKFECLYLESLSNKHTSLVQKSINHSQKKFYNIDHQGPML